jgi:hypothetical protein
MNGLGENQKGSCGLIIECGRETKRNQSKYLSDYSTMNSSRFIIINKENKIKKGSAMLSIMSRRR